MRKKVFKKFTSCNENSKFNRKRFCDICTVKKYFYIYSFNRRTTISY